MILAWFPLNRIHTVYGYRQKAQSVGKLQTPNVLRVDGEENELAMDQVYFLELSSCTTDVFMLTGLIRSQQALLCLYPQICPLRSHI